MKLINEEIFLLGKELKKLKEKDLAFKLKYLVVKNLKSIQDNIDAINEVNPEKIKNEIEEKRIELIKQYGDKDNNGELIINEEKGTVSINENLEKFQSEFKEYYDSRKDEIEEMNKAFQEILQEEEDVKLNTIPIKIFPNDIDIDPENLFPILKEE